MVRRQSIEEAQSLVEVLLYPFTELALALAPLGEPSRQNPPCFAGITPMAFGQRFLNCAPKTRLIVADHKLDPMQ